MNWRGKNALITGASYGIGAAYCEILSSQGCNLVMVARDIEKLKQLSSDLSAKHGIKTYILKQDLKSTSAAKNIFAFTTKENINIDLLINNAGFSNVEGFVETDMQKHNGMIHAMLNVVVELCHGYLPSMLQREGCGIINVASVVAFINIKHKNRGVRSLYSPIKSFVALFSEQLHANYCSQGVAIQCLCPGLTVTEFHKRIGEQDLYKNTPKFLWQTAAEVAAQSLTALEKSKKAILVTGFINKVAIFCYRLIHLWP